MLRRRLRPKRSMQDRAAADWVGARYVAGVRACVRDEVDVCARARPQPFLCHAFLEFGNAIMYRAAFGSFERRREAVWSVL